MASTSKVIFKFGTKAEYLALETKLSNALYFLTDVGELYRGSVPFGQAKVYSGSRLTDEADNTCITRLLGNNLAAINDLVLIDNTDSTRDIFMYLATGWTKLNDASAINSLKNRVTTLEGNVADLTALLNGTPGDEQAPGTTGLADRVTALETSVGGLAGAFHFKGSQASYEDLQALVDPAEGDVYQVGADEYAWNGTTWVKLGGNFDLSGYATTTYVDSEIASLEALIGHPQQTVVDPETGDETTIPASGIYADLQSNPESIIPIFDGTINGLVPLAPGTATNAEKANLFMNALGTWVTVSGGSGSGTVTYTDPEGHVYTDINDYFNYMMENHALEWESISD